MKTNRTDNRFVYIAEYIINIVWLVRVPIVSVSLLLLINAFTLSEYPNYIFPCISTVFMLFGGYIINDILDINIDVVSAPNRPLPSGKISLKTGKVMCISCLGLALLFALLSENLCFVLYIVVYAIMFWVYTKYLKSNWAVKNGVTALFFSSMALIPVIFEVTTFSRVFPLFAIAFIFTLGREILMDVRDFDGDKIIQKQKRLPTPKSLCLSSLLILTSFVIMEIIYLSFSILRYTTVIFVCAMFVICFRQRKKVWLCTETIKIIFLVNLFFLLIEI